MSITRKIALIILFNTIANVVILYILIVPTIRRSYTEQNNDSLRYGVRSLAYSTERYLRNKFEVIDDLVDDFEDYAFDENIVTFDRFNGQTTTVFELGTTTGSGEEVIEPSLVEFEKDTMFINNVEVSKFMESFSLMDDLHDLGGTLIVYSYRNGAMIPSYISNETDAFNNRVVSEDAYFEDSQNHVIVPPYIAAGDRLIRGLRHNRDIIRRIHYGPRRVYWYFSTPLQDDSDQMIGSVAILVPELNLIRDISDIIDPVRLGGENGYAFILDHNGYMVYHPISGTGNNKWIVPPGSTSEDQQRMSQLVRDIYKKRNDHFTYSWDHPKAPKNFSYEKILYSESIEEWGWIVCIAPYEIEFSKRINDAFRRITLIMVLSGIIIVFIFLPVSRRLITDRIVKINNSLKRFSENDYDHALPDHGRDEIGSLARSFFDMGNEIVQNMETLNEKVRQRTADLKVAQERAEAAAQIKADFLANMSHEIRTPLNAIIGFSYLALGKEMEESLEAYFTKIHTAATNLLQIINDILDFSKIEAGKLTVEEVDFDLSKVCEDVKNIMGMKSEEKGIDFIVTLEPDLPLDLKGDPLRLTQILTNLCNNAIKFTKKGEVSLAIGLDKTKPINAKHPSLRFEVKDSGIGMSEEQQKNLFTAFQQADTSTTRRFGGTGLGLSICKQLVSLMGGEITVKSAPNKGSTFLFTIAMPIGQKMLRSTNYAGKKVLVVDDNQHNLSLLEDQLNFFGFEVTSLVSGREVIAHMRNVMKEDVEDYDLLLVDWRMPDIDGLETVSMLQKQSAKIPPVVIVTSYYDSSLKDKSRSLGINRILPRPFSLSDLNDTLSDALGLTVVRRFDDRVDKSLDFDFTTITGAKVLLAEDNDINRMVAEEMLERTGIYLTSVTNGQEALDIIGEGEFDLLLIDIQMPVLDGHRTTRAIRDGGNTQLPIIAMTAHALVEEKERCLASGMNDLITKPLDPQRLYATLLKYIPHRHQQIVKNNEESKAEEKSSDLDFGSDTSELKFSEALSRLSGNRKLLLSILEKFIESYGDPEKMIQDIGDDHEKLIILAHTVKGLSGNIGAVQLQKSAEDLEMILREHPLSSNGNQIKGKFMTDIESLCALIRERLKMIVREERGSITSGNPVEMRLLLNEAGEIIKKRNAREAKKLANQIKAKEWSDNSKDMEKLAEALSDYRFSEAKNILKILTG